MIGISWAYTASNHTVDMETKYTDVSKKVPEKNDIRVSREWRWLIWEETALIGWLVPDLLYSRMRKNSIVERLREIDL